MSNVALVALRSGRALMRRCGDVDDGERLEAEEVELDEARLLDVVLVVLGDELVSPFGSTGT